MCVCPLAVGEGAIEGSAKDYEILATDKFSAAFKYSRWNLAEAPARNVSSLTGSKRSVKVLEEAAHDTGMSIEL